MLGRRDMKSLTGPLAGRGGQPVQGSCKESPKETTSLLLPLQRPRMQLCPEVTIRENVSQQLHHVHKAPPFVGPTTTRAGPSSGPPALMRDTKRPFRWPSTYCNGDITLHTHSTSRS